MNVPTTPGQQVQVQQAPAAYGQVAPTGNAQILGAAAQAAQQFGQQAGDRAAELHAKDVQTEVLNASNAAYKARDERYVMFRGLSGDLAEQGGRLAVADYQKWAADFEATLSPEAARIFNPHAEEIGLGLQRDVGNRVFDIKEGMAHAALTESYNGDEQAAFGIGASGLVTLRPSAEAGPSGTMGTPVLDERALLERVNHTRSAGKVWLEAHPGAQDIEAETTRQAVARVYAAAIQGNLEPGPHQNYKVAQRLFDEHAEELGEQREKMQALTSNATIVGSADDAEKAAFFMEAKNEGSTSERQESMNKNIDAMWPPKQVSDKDAWRDRVKAGAKQREQQFQQEQATRLNGFQQELDADIMGGKYRDFAQVEQSAKYAALAKEPGLQRALKSTWKQYDSGVFTVTKPEDKADAIDMLTNPDRANEAMTYNFAAHPQRFSHDDIAVYEGIQRDAFSKAAAGADDAKTGLYTNLTMANRLAKDYYPGKESDKEVMAARGTFLDEADALVRMFKGAHEGKPPSPEWLRKEIDVLHAERTMRLPQEFSQAANAYPPWDPRATAPWVMKTSTYPVEETFALIDRIPAERLNAIISDLLQHDMEPTAEAIMARLADTQARTEAAGGY